MRAFLTILFLFFAAGAAAQDPVVENKLDRSQVYFGDSATYTIVVRNVEKHEPPQLKMPDGLVAKELGNRSTNSIIAITRNGVRKEMIRLGHEYTYTLSPTKPGVFKIPAPTVLGDGKELTGRFQTLTVRPPDVQSNVLFEIETDHERVYPSQPFVVTFRILIRELPGSMSNRNPLDIYKTDPLGFPGFSRRGGPGPPILEVPWLDDDQLAAGLEAQESLSDMLRRLATDDGRGFRINGLQVQTALSLISDSATAFRLRSKKTTRQVGKKKNRYWQYELSRTFTAFAANSFEFGPAKIRGYFVEEKDGKLGVEQLYVIAPKKTVVCQDVPTEGQPKNYIGAAGQFTLSSSLSPRKANVGDPMTFSIRLKGTGNHEYARPPKIDEIPGVQDAFQVQTPTSDTEKKQRVFTYSVRPKRADVREFPAITASYFDVRQEKYIELKTKPISVTISAAQRLATADIVSSNIEPAVADAEVADNDGVFANRSDPRDLRDQRVRPKLWFGLWGTMIGCYAIAALALGQYRRRQSDPSRLRRRASLGRAEQNLADARTALQNGDTDKGVENIKSCFTELVADLANRDAAGITPRDATRLLSEVGLSETVTTQVRSVLEACDAIRYGSGEGTGGLVTEAEKALTATLAEVKASGLVR